MLTHSLSLAGGPGFSPLPTECMVSCATLLSLSLPTTMNLCSAGRPVANGPYGDSQAILGCVKLIIKASCHRDKMTESDTRLE